MRDIVAKLDWALSKRRDEQYAQALAEFKRLEKLTNNPRDIAMLRFFQTTCLTDLGRTADAAKLISEIDKANLGFANQVDFEFEYARIERAEGIPHRALARIVRALSSIEALNDRSEILMAIMNMETLRAILLAEIGKLDEAIPLLKGVPSQDTGWAEARMCLGDCFYKLRNYRRAIDAYRDILSSDKRISAIIKNDAIRNIGCAHYDLGEYDKAIEHLNKVKRAYDSHPDLKEEVESLLASAYSRLAKT